MIIAGMAAPDGVQARFVGTGTLAEITAMPAKALARSIASR
jgi:hypothetical protein